MIYSFARITAAVGMNVEDLVQTAGRSWLRLHEKGGKVHEMRPDRIIMGEVRDGLALDLQKAWLTGHPGGLATNHANSAAVALTRLEDLIGEVTQRVPYRAIVQAINVVVFIERTATCRRIWEVSRLVGRDGETYRLETIGQ